MVVPRSRAVPARAVQDGRIQLIVARVEVDEQLENLVCNFVQPRVRAVDLVDDNDDLVPKLK